MSKDKKFDSISIHDLKKGDEVALFVRSHIGYFRTPFSAFEIKTIEKITPAKRNVYFTDGTKCDVSTTTFYKVNEFVLHQRKMFGSCVGINRISDLILNKLPSLCKQLNDSQLVDLYKRLKSIEVDYLQGEKDEY